MYVKIGKNPKYGLVILYWNLSSMNGPLTHVTNAPNNDTPMILFAIQHLAGGRASNHSSAFSSFGNSSRPCSGPDPEFFCNRDDFCIPMALHCDEKDDCSDGEDEIGCKLKCDKAHLFACEYILVCN